MVMVDIPRKRTRWRLAAGASPAGSGLAVLGLEVTQTVQDPAHSVRLIAGKPTAVRAYVEPRGLAANVRMKGEIVVSTAPGAPGTYVSSANQILLRANGHPNLSEQRRDAALSLNFLLPRPPVGPLTVRFKRAIPVAGGPDVPLTSGNEERSVHFASAPPLRVRALGLRYTDSRVTPTGRPAPDPTDFNHLRSFLARTYPVSAVEWTQAVIDAPANFVPPFSGTPLPNGSDPLWLALLQMVHVQLMTVRQADMDAGWDPRTHYYGLVSDKSGFFRGAANDVPDAPAPGVVAVGPCGLPGTNFAWDRDGSYCDWYGAHELAHTFGRPHPGFCGQGNNDAAFPHAQGRISDAAQDAIGFDVGDTALNLDMHAYPHEQWHDIMTYCDRQWLSKYTYDGLYDRLVAEEALFAPPVA